MTTFFTPSLEEINVSHSSTSCLSASAYLHLQFYLRPSVCRCKWKGRWMSPVPTGGQITSHLSKWMQAGAKLTCHHRTTGPSSPLWTPPLPSSHTAEEDSGRHHWINYFWILTSELSKDTNALALGLFATYVYKTVSSCLCFCPRNRKP